VARSGGRDISPTTTLAWWRALRRNQGEARVAQAARLFLVPGLAHCRGGAGATRLDTLTPLLRWVEEGAAPERIEAQDGPPVFAFKPGHGAKPQPFLVAERFGPAPLAWCVGATCASR